MMRRIPVGSFKMGFFVLRRQAAFFLVYFVAALFSAGAAFAAETSQDAADSFSREKTWRIGGALLRLSPELDSGQQLDVIVDGVAALTLEDFRLTLENWMHAPDGAPFPKPGTNVTGGDTPQVVVSGFSGGAHCCITLTVIDLGEKPKQISVPVGGHYYSYLEKRAGEKSWIAIGHDGQYAYWRTSFADSPAPLVLFRYEDGAWRMAANLMRRPAPSDRALKKQAEEVRKLPGWSKDRKNNAVDIPVQLWSEALDLVYGGNMAAAERFIDLAWKPGFAGKEAFRRELFGCRLAQSIYWPELAAMNNRPAKKPESDCP